MNRIPLLAALSTALVALAPAVAVAAPPLYFVLDGKPTKLDDRRVVMVRVFNNGDARACEGVKAHYQNAQCVRELPAQFAPLLQDAGLPKAYVLKFTSPTESGASYRAMFDMSTKDPQQVCRNLVDYQQRFGRLPENTRIRCWVPRG